MERNKSCLGCLGGCVTRLLLLGAAGLAFVWLLTVALNPWALHIGGQSTPLLYWHGSGTVLAKDGKTYPLYLWFSPGRPGKNGGGRREGRGWSANLTGTAWLCVAPGHPERMQISGTMYGGYRSSADSIFEFRLLEWRKPFSIDPPNRGFFDLAGQFHGGELVMDRRSEQGIRLKTGPFIDNATATLRFSDQSAFDQACR